MQSIELEFEMQQLLITAMAGEGIFGKGVALLFNKPLALLWEL